MRKEAGFEVQDRIQLYYSNNDRIGRIIESNRKKIAEEVLARKLQKARLTVIQKWNINDERVVLTVVRI